MPEVQTSTPGVKLARRYGIKGTIIAPSLEPVIVPVVLIDDLSEDLPTVAFACAAENIAAAAGQPQTALTNPVGSGVLLEDIRLGISHESTAITAVWQSGPALSSAGEEFFEDRDRAGSPHARVTLGTDVGAVADEIRNVRQLDNTLVVFDLTKQVLGEGDRIHLLAELGNIALSFQWTWSERVLSAEERF